MVCKVNESVSYTLPRHNPRAADAVQSCGYLVSTQGSCWEKILNFHSNSLHPATYLGSKFILGASAVKTDALSQTSNRG